MVCTLDFHCKLIYNISITKTPESLLLPEFPELEAPGDDQNEQGIAGILRKMNEFFHKAGVVILLEINK